MKKHGSFKFTILLSLTIFIFAFICNVKCDDSNNFIPNRLLENTTPHKTTTVAEHEKEALTKITAEYDPNEKVIIYNGMKYLDEHEVKEHGEVDISKLSWNYIITNSFIILRKSTIIFILKYLFFLNLYFYYISTDMLCWYS